MIYEVIWPFTFVSCEDKNILIILTCALYIQAIIILHTLITNKTFSADGETTC